MSAPTASGHDHALCDLLLPGLLEAGFTEPSLRALASQPELIRRTLARALAHLPSPASPQAGEDPSDSSCPMFTADIQPLALEPSEWLEFIDERNRRGQHRPCEVVSDADYGRNAIFRVKPSREPTRLLLLETANGLRPMAALEATAERLLPGWLSMTTPRAVFEALRLLWDQLNDINAAYVMIAPGQSPAGVPLPIIFNPPQGGVRLGFVKQVPRNSGYTGYLAFCGTAG